MGAGRLYGWLEWALEVYGPTDVVLGVGSQELAWSLPVLWSGATGLSWRHPAGACLVPGAGGPEVREPSGGWVVRQRDPRTAACWPGTDVAAERAMLEERLPRVDGVPAEGFAGACIAKVGGRAREGGARFFVALTDDGPAWRDAALMAAYRRRVGIWAAGAGATLVDATGAVADLSREGISPIRPGGGLSVDGHRVLGLVCGGVLADGA
jgi:hypothetical protein